MKSIALIAAILTSTLAACGGDSKPADPKAVCEQIKKLEEANTGGAVLANNSSTVESCVTEQTAKKKEAGDEAYGDYYKCLKAGKSDDAIYPCETSLSLAIEGAKLSGGDVESKISAAPTKRAATTGATTASKK